MLTVASLVAGASATLYSTMLPLEQVAGSTRQTAYTPVMFPVTYDDDTNILTISIDEQDFIDQGVTDIGNAHVHTFANGGVFNSAATGILATPWSGTTLFSGGEFNNPAIGEITDAEEALLLTGTYYVNIHTSFVGSGEFQATLDFSGVATGDPHFIGFDGSKYNFDGFDGGVFNLLSTEKLQLNSRFSSMMVDSVNGTWMESFGLVTRADKAIIDNRGLVLVNDRVVRPFSQLDGETIQVENQERSVSIRTEEFQLDFDRVQTKTGQAYYNIHVSVRAPLEEVHGVLGQSIRPFSVLEGSEESYIVHDGILGTDTPFAQLKL